MKKTLCAAFVAVVASSAVLVPSASRAAAPGLPAAAAIRDQAGDEDVVLGKAPTFSLDLRKLRYTQGENGALRVVITADDVRGKRAHLTENFSATIFRDSDFQSYTVHHRADGGLRVLDFTDPSGKVEGYRIPGKFFVRPAKNEAVFVIPTRAIGAPKSVRISAGSYLEDSSSNVKTLDFVSKGPRISLR